MLIDTHCHLSEEYYDDLEKTIDDDFKAVDKIIISGCDKVGIEESLKIAEKYDNIFVTIGYHPDQVDVVTDEDIKYLEEHLSDKKVVGLGEIGLDYHYTKDDRDLQIKLFERQLSIAEKLNIPVVIHSREATEDTINTLSKYKVHGVIHAFSGSYETACKYISMGFLLGVGGVLTFKNSKLYQVIEKLSLENLVLETDSPYLTPHPYRGLTNSSKYIPLIAKRLAEVMEKSEEEVAEKTSKNACSLFDLV